VKISGELPMMVLPNHKYLKKLFLEVSKMNQVESLQGKKKEKEKRRITTIVLDVFLYGL